MVRKNARVVMVIFPPQCTHRLQPSDAADMRPLREKYDVAQND